MFSNFFKKKEKQNKDNNIEQNIEKKDIDNNNADTAAQNEIISNDFTDFPIILDARAVIDDDKDKNE